MSEITTRYAVAGLLMLAGFGVALGLAFWAERKRKRR